MSPEDRQDDYFEAFIETVASSPIEIIPVSVLHEDFHSDFPFHFDKNSQDTTVKARSLPAAVPRSNPKHKYRCCICDKSFDRQSRADACKNRHLQERPYICDGRCGYGKCSRRYGSEATLRRHWEGSISCLMCGKEIRKGNMARHKNSRHSRQ
ncbi:hypothetical protein M408DRAFT_330725 [Serendipita vermifera MAFF 305830]|uniref:C2H2-type domain-containing protein n=1 Tax=Serendipita vermifera MAFF 305830 TaxID=933852 RepID=A0A0C3ANK5_SERVB|nr:hypothetical protein M408DRAFT_330725 [Serendipita vermifera MAFF 305830]